MWRCGRVGLGLGGNHPESDSWDLVGSSVECGGEVSWWCLEGYGAQKKSIGEV